MLTNMRPRRHEFLRLSIGILEKHSEIPAERRHERQRQIG